MDVFVFTQPHHLQTRIRTCAKLPELLASGCFIVSTDLDEPIKYIKKNGEIVEFKGLKDPTYPERFAKVLRRLYNNPRKVKNGILGREKAEKNFSYPVLRKKLNEILKKPFSK